MKKVFFSLLCVIGMMAMSAGVVKADQSQYKKLNLSESRSNYKPLDLPNDTVKKFSNITWSTNLLEWMIFAPNIGFEYDLKDPTVISCPSIFFQLSYRPGKERFLDKKDYTTSALYYLRARAEYRWHFRFNERKDQRRGLTKAAMWVNEQWLTKPIEVMVPDTAGINAGNPYATKLVMSKEARIQQKIDSTVTSTVKRRTEMFPGRYYIGAYGEYMNVTINNKMILKGFKNGNVFSAGITGGYDFPGFNYNHKRFLQWSLGASAGLMFFRYDAYRGDGFKSAGLNKIFPFITELKVGLNFRNTTISKKYWQPDASVYAKNVEANRQDSIHMAELDSILEANPVAIQVHSVNGVDSAFVENVDKNMIVSAFQQSTGLTYLLPTNFNMLAHTQTSLDNKELSDNYYIEYITNNRLRNYGDSVYVNSRRNLPFRVEIAGRAEADSLKKSFVDSLKNYYAANGNQRPIFYGEPASRDSLKEFISKDSIAARFSSIWGHKLDTAMIRTLYVGRNEKNDDGTFSTYYDSVITQEQINRREIYAMFIQFHPQVTLSGEDEGVARFRVAMAGAEDARALYNNVAEFFNNIARSKSTVRIQRPWNGVDDSFVNPINKQEVIAAMHNLGLSDIDENIVSIEDGINQFTIAGAPETVTFHFGVTENDLSLPFVIEDSIGKAQAQSLWNDTIRPWRDGQYWLTNSGLYEDDPKVPGYFDEESGKWLVNPQKFVEAVKEIIFAEIKPYQLDDVTFKVNETPYKTGNYQGKYRAQARIVFHREIKNSRGEMFSTTIPYLIVPVETKEEAGLVAPAAAETAPEAAAETSAESSSESNAEANSETAAPEAAAQNESESTESTDNNAGE
ncbi:MAG: hypothetical protein KBT20_05825 [Bacteroidales bacterium]|nr:hypothetical protein [Candidatus Liminaster caballi]